MENALPNPHPHHHKHLALICLGIGIIISLIYHFFLGARGYGISLVIFMASAVAGALVIGAFTGNRGNKWSNIFLIPIILGSAASMLYAGDVPRALGLCLAFLGLIFFLYWLTAPSIPFVEVPHVWHLEIVDDLLRSGSGATGALKETQIRGSADTSKILRGLIIAVPFFFVFLFLFATADTAFRTTLENIFSTNFSQRFWFYEIPRDLIITFFVTGLGWTMLTRSFEERRAKWTEHLKELDTTVTGVFLGVLNALFLVFAYFQIKYVFGDVDGFITGTQTYAQAARQGFSQLLLASGLVFGIVWYLYRTTNLRVAKIRYLTLALIAETGVIIASALRRVMLYMNEYGYTVSRIWAIFVILTIAAVLLTIAIAAILKKEYRGTLKKTFLAVFLAYSTLLFVNVENIVANENISRYLNGETSRLDTQYLGRLSSDAVPAIHGLIISQANGGQALNILGIEKCLLEKRLTADWRNLVFSDYRALAILSDTTASVNCVER
ncbi:MAG: DUF4173 domain-containing protein [bacterium]